MIILLIISATIFIAYTTSIALKYGIQKSISASYYKLPEKLKFIFTFVLWGFAIPVIIVGDNALMFLAGSMIAFVGASPMFKLGGAEKMVHMIGAYSGIIFGYLALVLVYEEYILSLISILIIALFYIMNKATKTWWIETVAFLTIIIGLFINNL